MLRTILRTAAVFALAASPWCQALAQEDEMVASVAPEVAELISGGSWSAGDKGGFYRAMVLMSGDEKSFGAHVYVQWLAFGEAGPVPQVIATAPIKEINEQKLDNASILIEGEEGAENEVTLVVSSYDFDEDRDIVLFVKATAPGSYTMVKAPPKGAKLPSEDEDNDDALEEEAPGIED